MMMTRVLAPVTVIDSLRRKCVGYWKLDESSGQAFDSLGWLNLTDNNTVTANPGKINGARQFTSANTEYFSRANEARFNFIGVDFSMCCWVYHDTVVGNQMYITKDASGQRAFNMYFAYPSGQISFAVSTDGSNNIVLNGTVTPATTTWYWVYAEWDVRNGKIGLRVNNGALSTATASGGCVATTSALEIGRHGFGNPMNGRIDQAMLFRGRLSDHERAWIYNNGSGRDIKL